MSKSRNPYSLCFVFLLLFLTVSGKPVFSQVEGDDVIIGTSVTLTSEVLGRDIVVRVHLPAGYNNGEIRYPVLYDLNAFFCYTYDCGTVELLARSSDIPDIIVVGVPALDNGYVPTPYEERGDDLAGADWSLKFLEEELIPFMEDHYRTNGYRILYGHSVGGLFTMYTLFTHSDLFTAYIAGSPWFQNNDQYWLNNLDRMTEERDVADKFLFMTVGNDEDQLTIDTYKELESWMNNQDLSGLTWKSAWLEGDHASMVGRNIYDGLLFIFKDWKIPQSLLIDADVDAIEELRQNRTARWSNYGFSESEVMPEQRLNMIGYTLIFSEEYDKAITIFEYNMKLHPNSYNAHDSLAEGYMMKGDRESAITYYRKAVKMNPADTDRAKRVLENSKDKLRELSAGD